jgi:hypothetical protein
MSTGWSDFPALCRRRPRPSSPYGQGNPPEQFPGDYSLQNIIDGKFVQQLTAWADVARKTNIPILAEFGIEENNSFGPWADWNGAGVTAGYGDPTFPDGAGAFPRRLPPPGQVLPQ